MPNIFQQCLSMLDLCSSFHQECFLNPTDPCRPSSTPTASRTLLFTGTWMKQRVPHWRASRRITEAGVRMLCYFLAFLSCDCQNTIHPLRVISSANLTPPLSLILFSFQGPWAPCFRPGTQNLLGISVKGAFREHKAIEDRDWPLCASWSQDRHCPYMSWGLGIIGWGSLGGPCFGGCIRPGSVKWEIGWNGTSSPIQL